MTLPSQSDTLSPSAELVLRSLRKHGGMTWQHLLVRVRPMSSEGVQRSIDQLEAVGLVRVSSMAFMSPGRLASEPVPYIEAIPVKSALSFMNRDNAATIP